jgi:RNA exonuclease 1
LQYWLDNPHTAPKPLPTVEVSVDNGFPNVQPCNSLCVFHPGTVVRGTKCWDCCDQHVSEPTPCGISSVHVLRKFDPVHLDRLYQMYDTPPVYNAQQENCPIRDAVSIDCEMGTAETGDPELIRVSAVDYFTGEILVNNIVNPDQPMQHLNTKYSGVTWGQMNHALRSRKALEGKAGARDALWRFVGPNTILVGHAVNNDLRALRWIHPRVVDSFMIEYKIVQARKEAEATAAVAAAKEKAGKEAEQEAERQLLGLPARPMTDGSTPPLTVHGKFTQGTLAVPEPKKKKPKGSGDLALKTLMKKYLGKDVQMQGNKGHDSLEDAVAARDLVHWMIMRRLARHPVNAEDFDGMN